MMHYAIGKPKKTKETWQGKIVYVFNGLELIRDAKSGCNALEGYKKIRRSS